MHYAPVKAGKIVNACAVLHNFVYDQRFTIDDEEILNDRSQQPEPTAHERRNHQNLDGERQGVVERLWSGRHLT